jgi:hypothetical protein
MSSNFYIYFLILGNEIVYIGKGKNDRAKKHLPLLKENKHINTKLQNKYNKYCKKNITFLEKIVYENLSEAQAFSYEKYLIDQIGLENLCNLTVGGEGGDCITNNPRREEIIKKSAKSRIGRKISKETIEKIQKTKQEWYSSQDYIDFKNKMSDARKGKNNPMYGRKEDEEHKKERMKNFLAKPKWNKGLTKENDSRIKGPPSGKIPYNAKKIVIQNIETEEIIELPTIKSFYDLIKKELGKCNTKKAYALTAGKLEKYEKWVLLSAK